MLYLNLIAPVIVNRLWGLSYPDNLLFEKSGTIVKIFEFSQNGNSEEFDSNFL